MERDKERKVHHWISAMAPGWVLISPGTVFGGPCSFGIFIWTFLFAVVGPCLSSGAAVARIQIFFSTEAFQIPSALAKDFLSYYIMARPMVAPFLYLLQWLLLVWVLRGRLHRNGIPVKFCRLLPWVGLAATPIFLKHLITACFRLRAPSMQSLALWPTSLLAWLPSPRYTSGLRILWERIDMMDLWALCLLYSALFWITGGRRGVAFRICLYAVVLVLIRDFLLWGAYSALTSVWTLDWLLEMFPSEIEYLYHV